MVRDYKRNYREPTTMSGDQRRRRQQPRMPQTPEEIAATCEIFRAMLRAEYARQDVEDEKLLAEMTALADEMTALAATAAEQTLARSDALLADLQAFHDALTAPNAGANK